MKKITKKDVILLVVSIIFLISTVVGFVVILLNSDLYRREDDTVDVEAGGQQKVDPEDINSNLTVNIYGIKFEYILFEEIDDIKDEQFIIVITKEGCSACEKFMNNLIIFKSKYTSISVYLINFDTLSSEQKQEYARIPGYLFYNEGKHFFTGRGNVEAEKLYEKFTSNLKGE